MSEQPREDVRRWRVTFALIAVLALTLMLPVVEPIAWVLALAILVLSSSALVLVMRERR